MIKAARMVLSLASWSPRQVPKKYSSRSATCLMGITLPCPVAPDFSSWGSGTAPVLSGCCASPRITDLISAHVLQRSGRVISSTAALIAFTEKYYKSLAGTSAWIDMSGLVLDGMMGPPRVLTPLYRNCLAASRTATTSSFLGASSRSRSSSVPRLKSDACSLSASIFFRESSGMATAPYLNTGGSGLLGRTNSPSGMESMILDADLAAGTFLRCPGMACPPGWTSPTPGTHPCVPDLGPLRSRTESWPHSVRRPPDLSPSWGASSSRPR